MKSMTKVIFLLVIVTIHVTQIYGERGDRDRHRCDENQVWSNCTTGCPARCIPDDRVCPQVCGPPGCVCAPDFKLNDDGECVIC